MKIHICNDTAWNLNFANCVVTSACGVITLTLAFWNQYLSAYSRGNAVTIFGALVGAVMLILGILTAIVAWKRIKRKYFILITTLYISYAILDIALCGVLMSHWETIGSDAMGVRAESLQCCGYNGPYDYIRYGGSLPRQCCGSEVTKCSYNQAFKKGCGMALCEASIYFKYKLGILLYILRLTGTLIPCLAVLLVSKKNVE